VGASAVHAYVEINLANRRARVEGVSEGLVGFISAAEQENEEIG
jgi:hypothetical protein